MLSFEPTLFHPEGALVRRWGRRVGLDRGAVPGRRRHVVNLFRVEYAEDTRWERAAFLLVPERPSLGVPQLPPVGSPAHAGIDLPRLSARGSKIGFPRTRGVRCPDPSGRLDRHRCSGEECPCSMGLSRAAGDVDLDEWQCGFDELLATSRCYRSEVQDQTQAVVDRVHDFARQFLYQLG